MRSSTWEASLTMAILPRIGDDTDWVIYQGNH